MELEQLKTAWAQQTQRIDHLEGLVAQAWQQPRQQEVRRRLRWFSGMQLAWLLAWIVVTALAATFWIAHRQVTQLLLTGLAFHVYGIAAIWVSITRALLALQLHGGDAPVVTQQLRLARLRRFTAVTELALGLPWFCLWLLALQWACVQWLGLDLYAAAPRWFLATLGVGVVAMIGAVAAARWGLRQVDAQHWARRWLDSLSGQSLLRAQRTLQDIQAFKLQ